MLNIRRPAFPGLKPGGSIWRELSEKEKSILIGYLDNELVDSLQKRESAHSDQMIGYYRSTGKEKVFLKVVSAIDSDSQSEAEKIATWLHRRGASVSCVKNEYPTQITGSEVWLYLYEYVEHDFSNGSEEQLYEIGKEIGFLHYLMKNHPYSDTVYKKGQSKNNTLFQQFKNIKKGFYTPSFSNDAVDLLKRTDELDFEVLNHSGQMIHGDLNLGNILIRKGYNLPVIIDFEDATASWLSPLFDLAFIIQRLVLPRNSAERTELASILFSGYKSRNKQKTISHRDQLSKTMKMISIRSLLVLSTLPDNKQIDYQDEVEKFVDLYTKTEESMDFILGIEKLV